MFLLIKKMIIQDLLKVWKKIYWIAESKKFCEFIQYELTTKILG